MNLSDIMNGPDWILWVIIIAFAVISIVLISGHGSLLIAGYNTAPPEKKKQYNEKRMCRTVGVGMAVITLMMLIMALFDDILPAYFAHIFGAAVVMDCIIMIILFNTFCKKK